MGNCLPCCCGDSEDKKGNYELLPAPKLFPDVQRCNVYDLHGYSKQKALQKVKDVIKNKKNEVRRIRKDIAVEFITGRGNHSKHHIPVIRPAVVNYLNTNGYKYKYGDWSHGAVIVLIPFTG